jgi:hypothetical protein
MINLLGEILRNPVKFVRRDLAAEASRDSHKALRVRAFGRYWLAAEAVRAPRCGR